MLFATSNNYLEKEKVVSGGLQPGTSSSLDVRASLPAPSLDVRASLPAPSLDVRAAPPAPSR